MDRFLVFSDLHLNLWNYGARLTSQGKNSRLIHQIDVLKDMEEYALSNNIEHIFFCGDLFHTHDMVKTEVLQEAMKLFLRWSSLFKVYFLVGNHDFADRAGSIHALEFLKSHFKVADTEKHLFIEGRPISFLPYTEDEETVDNFLKNLEPDTLAFMHQGVAGVELNSKGFTLKGEVLTANKVPDHVLHVFTGHYHSHKRVTPKLTIVGSPLQLTWNDKNERRGFLDVELDPFEITHVESEAPKFIEVSNPLDVEAIGNFVRYKVKDPKEVLAAREELEKGSESVEIIVEEDKEIEPVESADFMTIEDLFEEFLKTNDLDPLLVEVGKEIIND